jgi:hypothetical protein
MDALIDIVALAATVRRTRVVFPTTEIAAADKVIERIIETYIAPNRSLHELRTYMREGHLDFLLEFGDACRADLAARQ